jgi:diacylglycerol kinase family enzyme
MRSITLGRVNGRRFLFSAGLGFDGEAVRRVNGRGRRPDGRRASNFVYALTVARTLTERHLRVEPQLEVEGHGRAAFVFVANGHPYTYAGPVPFTLMREAEFDSGIDFVAPREVRPQQVPRLVLDMFRGAYKDDETILAGHDLDEIVVRCDRALPLQADGEDLGDVSEATFAAERNALMVLA